MTEEINIYEFVPQEIAAQIENSGEADVFVDSAGNEWLSCDRCGRWILSGNAEIVPGKTEELGYDSNGMPVIGAGTLVVCPKCAH